MFSKVKTLTHHGTLLRSNPSYRSFCVASNLNGKTALITGSTSGIGLSIAESLAAQGVKIVITGFGDTQHALNKVKSCALHSNKDRIYFVDADLSNKNEAINLVNSSIDKLGSNSLDIVINNAGLQHVCPIETFDDDKYLMMINIMLNSPFFITKTVMPYMRKNGYGRIINISSAHGLRSSPNKAPYCAAKHGLVGMTKSCALEMALEKNINWTANAICPGFVRTELAMSQVTARSQKSGKTFEEEEYGLLSEKHGTAEWVEPSAIGTMVKYLCSDDAKQITGAALSIDGGWTAR